MGGTQVTRNNRKERSRETLKGGAEVTRDKERRKGGMERGRCVGNKGSREI